MTDVDKVLGCYAAAWDERNEERRLELLGACWSTQGVYSDPGVELVGRKNLSDHIGRYYESEAMFSLEPKSAIDEHHGKLRVRWQQHNKVTQEVQEGMSFGVIDEDGLLQQMTGFFGPFPEAENQGASS